MVAAKVQRTQAAYSNLYFGNLLAIVVHATNTHDTVSGINPAKKVFHERELETIIFSQATDYKPIDPKYWFVRHKHIFGVWQSDYPEIRIYL